MRNHAHILIGVALLSGCNMAPKYVQPVPPVPASFPAAASSGGEAATAVSWQRFFGDPQLKTYIAAALANNRDLAAAAARIEQARAQFRIQQAGRLPQIDSSAGATRTQAPLGSLGLGESVGNGSITYNQYSVRVATSAFELDFWGRVRNLSESARRSYLATRTAYWL